MKRFWTNKRGDTLVEALVAILIAALGATLLATMVMVSTNVTASSNTMLQNLYQDENEATLQVVGKQNVRIDFGGKWDEVTVVVYGSTDGIFSRYEDVGTKGDT